MPTPINTAIRDYLSEQIKSCINTFQSADPALNLAISQLKDADLLAFKTQFLQELTENCEQYWLEAIEPIDGILFEYDYIYNPNASAAAYGVMFTDLNGFRVQAEPYYIDYKQFYYEFAAMIDPAPGVVLHVLNLLSTVDRTANDMFNDEGFVELKMAYLFTTFLALSMAFEDFAETLSFEKIVKKSSFHFLIQEHDSGTAYPLCIIE